MTKGIGPSPTANDLSKDTQSAARIISVIMAYMTNVIMETLETREAPAFKPSPSVIIEMIEPKTEIWRRRFLPNR